MTDAANWTLDNPVIQTRSGRFVRLLHPSIGEIDIEDIAGALSNINRYTGHTVLDGITVGYSVAQHSIWIAKYLEDHGLDILTCLAGLLHDAAEAYVNDDSWPKKRAMEQLAGFDICAKIAEPFEQVISVKFGLPWPWPKIMRQVVKEADNVALVTEKRDVMAPVEHPAWNNRPAMPSPTIQKISPWPAQVAEHVFLTEFHRYRNLIR